MITVKCTREGLIGGRCYTGYRVDPVVPFVALPSTAAVRIWVKVFNPLTNKQVRALVMDVGPWNEKDHAYVFQELTTQRIGIPMHLDLHAMELPLPGIRPQAESGIDTFGRATNGAGIDLGEWVWNKLGMVDNSFVCWEFE